MSGQNWRFVVISEDDIDVEDISVWLENFTPRVVDWDVDWDEDDGEHAVNAEFEYAVTPRMQRMLQAIRNLGYNVTEMRTQNTDDEDAMLAVTRMIAVVRQQPKKINVRLSKELMGVFWCVCG